MERQAGSFDFSAFDARVAQLAAAGLSQILVLDYGNPLYSAAGARANGVPDGPDFLRAARDAGAADYDAASVHLYTLYPPCAPPEGGANLCDFWGARPEPPFADQLRPVVAAAGGVPAYATEFGWPTWPPATGHGAVTPARQQDGGAKPASAAYAALFASAPGCFVRDRAAELGLAAGEHALLFEGASHLTTFVWREESAPARRIRVTLHGPAAISTLGGPASDASLDGAAATLTPGSRPVAFSCARP